MRYFAVVLAFFLSVLLPFVFVAIRESVKRQRQETIKDLQAVFHLPDAAGRYDIVPSFEFVKYKYFLKRADSDFNNRDDFRMIHWLASAIPLVMVCTFVNITVISLIVKFLPVAQQDFAIVGLKQDEAIPLYIWVIVSAYAGGFIFMLRALYRAISNFDLSPLSFVGACLNLSTGIIIALIFVFGLMHISQAFKSDAQSALATGMIGAFRDSFTFGAVIIASFAVGFMPELATRNILWSSRLRNYKKDDIKVYKSFAAIPVEVIDGIDTEIRDRLADFHINAVQNLAAANPLMLFVETPYGVYQIMDWVAQAQLCCSVGPQTLVKLWDLGIRTIFDLERAALDPACKNTALLRAIGSIIMNAPENNQDENMIIADIRLRLEHPHVQRLRQLFIRVRDRLGNDSQRLPPIEDCPLVGDTKCPFVRSGIANAA